MLRWMLGVLVGIVGFASSPARAEWRELAPGLEFGVFRARGPSVCGDSQIQILRADPGRWQLKALCAGQLGTQGMTGRDWAQRQWLVAVTNAGMFGSDYQTHVGYLVSPGCENNRNVREEYHSVAAFDPKTPEAPEFRVFDLEDPKQEMGSVTSRFESVLQNLRLVQRPGRNRWSQQEKKWSEAALGEDEAGRILFIFCRSPYSMHDLNRELLALDIGLVAAQHLEGGPEAQLYVEPLDLELFGSYETEFNENCDNAFAWPVPNVIGLVPKDRESGEP